MRESCPEFRPSQVNCYHARTDPFDEHSKIAGGLTQRRAELYGSVLTAWRTVNPPTTPDGEVEPRVDTMGSMWALRSGLRSVPHAGLSRVRAEPPDTDPYVRWCGTRGWLSKSVTGTRFCDYFGCRGRVDWNHKIRGTHNKRFVDSRDMYEAKTLDWMANGPNYIQ